MTTPQTLDGSPPGVGLWPQYKTDSAINEAAWLRAVAEGGFVGNCTCGGYLQPRQPEKAGKRTDSPDICGAVSPSAARGADEGSG